jgi:hypothetical protein
MANSQASIDLLRRQLQQAKSISLGDELRAMTAMVAHPDLLWSDLLDGLACSPGVVIELVAINLHSLLKVPLSANEERIIADRRFWEEILSERGINPNDKVPKQTQT